MIKTLAKSIREYKKDSILTPLFMMGEVILEVLIRLPRQVRCPHLRKMLCIHPTPSEEYRSTITYESVYFNQDLTMSEFEKEGGK